MNPNKAKGTKFETAVATYLAKHGLPEARRMASRGPRDEGDIGGIVDFAVECKDWARPDLTLFAELAKRKAVHASKEWGVTVFKRRRRPVEDAYVLTDLATFAAIVRRLKEGRRRIPGGET